MKWRYILPNIKGIPVLMYHNVIPKTHDGLTVSTNQLREQWNYLQSKGYHSLSIHEFYERVTAPKLTHEKCVLITFDDGYKNNLEHMYPLLKFYGFRATLFLIADSLDKSSKPTYEELMNLDELKQFSGNHIEFGLHGYHHENFSNTPLESLKESIVKSIQLFKENEIPVAPVLAYPYGARPKSHTEFKALKTWMSEQGIKMAFRIGNKPQKVPAKDLFEIKRIDIRGTDSFEDFRMKLKKGKLKPF